MTFTRIMMIITTILFLAVIISNNGVVGENDKTRLVRSRRNVAKNIDVYTLDHFISLVEKIERHKLTENKTMKTIAGYITKLDNSKWAKLANGQNSDALPDGVLTADEKRVITNMVNHRFVGQQERGVIHTPFGDVALGGVMTGISAGLHRKEYLVPQKMYQTDTSKHIDNLYLATIAGVLGLTGLVNKANPSLPLFGPAGTWSPNTQCPQTYNADMPSHSNATDAQILGNIDGFILGYFRPQWKSFHLGQLLRRYYNAELDYNKHFAACRRLETFNKMVKVTDVVEQVMFAGYVVKAEWNQDYDFSKVQNAELPQLALTTVQKFKTHFKQLQSRYSCPKGQDDGCGQLPVNLVFVLDESGSIDESDYDKEKEFVKKIIDAFHISSKKDTGTRVAIVEYSSDARETIKLGEVDTKSMLMCAVDNMAYNGGSTSTSKALQVAYDIIKKARSKQITEHRTSPDIMILLTDGHSDGGIATLMPIVDSFKKNMSTGLTMVAVGVGNYVMAELELIATDPAKHVLTTKDFSKLVTLVKQLREKTCKTSTILKPKINPSYQPSSDDDKANNSVEVTGYITPGKARYFILPSETLFKTENISIEIKPYFGSVTVYGSRSNASTGPENHEFKFFVDALLGHRRSTDNKKGKKMEFYNICKGYNATNCPPLFLSVYGENSTKSCSDLDCSVPDQIKFEIKAAQIVQEQTCFFHVSAAKLNISVAVAIMIFPVGIIFDRAVIPVGINVDNVTLFTSRTHQEPDENNHEILGEAREYGVAKFLTIVDPCKGFDKCPALYMSLRGSHVECSCSQEGECDVPKQVMIMTKHVQIERKDLCPDYIVSTDKPLEPTSEHIKATPTHSAVDVLSSIYNDQPSKFYYTDRTNATTAGVLPTSSTSDENDTFVTGVLPTSSTSDKNDKCVGFVKCPPLYLRFIGDYVSCDCLRDDKGQKHCSLSSGDKITFTKGHVACPPLYLSFIGDYLSCNCSTDYKGQKYCILPDGVQITFAKDRQTVPDCTSPVKVSAIIIIAGLLVGFFKP